MKPVRAVLPIALFLLLPLEVSALPPPRWFPLDPGNTWTYSCEEFPGWVRVNRVIAIEGDRVLVALGSDMENSTVLLAGTPDAVDIDLPGEGLVPFYRFSEASFVHRDPFECDDGVKVSSAGAGEDVKTPAGTFAGCLRLDFSNDRCTDAGRTSEWWAPDVGLVKWIDESISGPRSWVLEKFERRPVGSIFLRGDADGSGALDIADAIFTLTWLFVSGPAPSCLDAADTNDEGGVDISDPVSILWYLFIGSSAPPPPGPSIPGFDPTADDPFPCGDPPAFEAREEAWSTLPGVRFDLSSIPAVLTLGGAARGVTFAYRTVIDETVSAVTPFSLDAAQCDRPDASGLAVLETLRGGEDQVYCLCDMGRCMPEKIAVDLVPGSWEAAFPWDGRSWYGPSDTMNPEGPPFPPGIYAFTARAAGSYVDGTGAEKLFEVSASREFLLVP